MHSFGTFTTLHPQSLLRHLSSCSDTVCLQAFSNLVTWSIYLQQGTIIYATHSVEPFDRLERHLRRLSNQIPLLTNETRIQLRLMFETDSQNQFIEDDGNVNNQPSDYQAIQWLINQGHLDITQATLLIQELVKEVIESYLLIKIGSYELSNFHHHLPIICRLNADKTIECCQMQLQGWQSFAPQISSPYQRPYLLITSTFSSEKYPELDPNLTNWMKGFSLRHLAVIMNQDEIELVHNLYPYIIQGEIILHEPDPPFDQLPKILAELSSSPRHTTASIYRKLVDTVVELSKNATQSHPDIPGETIAPVQELPQVSASSGEKFEELRISNNINIVAKKVIAATGTPKKSYKIVSVDDSPTILKEISRFLENENFTVVAINDPLKAVMSIIRHKPNLILLDLNMAGIDGYELCRIIRNNSRFKNTPIIFVTSNKGIIDKVRARLVGASGYLTKPFTRTELLKIIFMHLT